MPLLPMTEEDAACDARGLRLRMAKSRRGLPKSFLLPKSSRLEPQCGGGETATGKWFHKLKNSSAIQWQAPKMDEQHRKLHEVMMPLMDGFWWWIRGLG